MRPEPLNWQPAKVERIQRETYRVKTYTLRLPDWRAFRPGQYFRVRLTAPDGYQAQRSYSIASSPGSRGTIDLTIELVDGGEVSTFFHEVVEIGDEIEVRGPIGGPFTWGREVGGPLLLVAGGSGIVPLMSMLRYRREKLPDVSTVLVYSSRSLEDIIYREELDGIAGADARAEVVHTLTRSQPEGWTGHSRRIDRTMMEEALRLLADSPQAYVCGPTPLVESVANQLVALDVPANRIRTERFGPSG